MILHKAAALALSGAMLIVSPHISPQVITSDAAANKARVSVHDKDGTYSLLKVSYDNRLQAARQ